MFVANGARSRVECEMPFVDPERRAASPPFRLVVRPTTSANSFSTPRPEEMSAMSTILAKKRLPSFILIFEDLIHSRSTSVATNVSHAVSLVPPMNKMFETVFG